MCYRDLPPLLTTLANLTRHSFAVPPKVLILAHKTDLLIRPTPPASPFPPNLPSTIRSTARERLKSILTREMDRLKSARGGGGVGGRIEGMGKVAGSGEKNWLSKMFGGVQSVATTETDGDGEDDEVLIWGGKGPFRWEDIEGVEVEWAVSALGMVNVSQDVAGAKKPEKGDGLDELKSFLLSV